MKKIFFNVVILLIALLYINGFAQPHNKEQIQHKFGKGFNELNLTDKQKDDLAKIRSENEKKAIDIRAEMQKLRIDIKDQFKEKNPNEETILSLNKKISDLQAQLKEAGIKMWFKSYNLLDDKQKEIWKNHFPEHMGIQHDGAGIRHKLGRLQHQKSFEHCPPDHAPDAPNK